jgi:outer membrane protein OmpA-like peptidoglycan-associated protein
VKVNGKGCPIDRDGDGVPDYLDKCPTVFGSITLDGCPDRDHDYVADNEDACPDVPGLVSNHGCPLKDYNNFRQNNNQQEADSDGDGVPDSKDNCPNTPRGTPVDEYGCPRKDQNDKDSDGDGVPDAVDRCPFSAGPASNKGCPEIKEAVKKKLEFATKGIYFETNKAIIKPMSYSKLNQIVTIVNDYPDYDVRLSGHTDNVGSDDYNLNLSQNRVDAVKAYLVNNGINANRINAIGYGKTMPVASNNSEVGKALNRRVEIELFLK